MKVAEALKRKWTQKIEESTHPQQHKNKGILYCVALESESENKTRQSKHCGFSIYIFDNSKSKSMVRLVRAEKMVLSGLVFARKIARMILIQNI